MMTLERARELAEYCVCSGAPDGLCLGVPGESDACGECLGLAPELPCLADPIMGPGGDHE